MSRATTIHKQVQAVCAVLLTVGLLNAQSIVAEIKAEHDPVRRSEKALSLANEAFDSAEGYYNKGQITKGDAELDNMMTALEECLSSLDTAHKSRYYKKAEMNVALLQRRMQGLLDDIALQQRGWAEYMQRKLDEVHDKLLDGVMRK